MKKLIFMISLLFLLSAVIYAQEGVTIEYLDLEGNIRQVLASDSGRIIVFRSDQTAEIDLSYDSGLLQQVTVRREDGSAEADILYSTTRDLQSITARREDDSAEAHIVYRDSKLSDIASFYPDGNLEAIAGYEDGVLKHLSIANSEQEQIRNEQQGTIEFFPTAQLLITDDTIVCGVE